MSSADPIMVRRVKAAQATLDRFKGAAFKLGKHDCVRMTASHLRLLGYKVRLPAAGSYGTIKTALKRLEERGFANLDEALEAIGLQPIPPAAAIAGDVLKLPAEHELGALAIALGNGRIVGYHEDARGAAVLQPLEILAAASCAPMKVVAKAALIIGAAVLVVATAGTGSFIAAGALSAGFSLGSAIAVGLSGVVPFLLSTTGILLVASAVLSAATGAKKPAEISGGSQTEFSADPRAGMPYAIGRTGTKGNIVFRRAADGWSDDTPNDLMDIVTVFSGAGPIEAIESFTSDKVAVEFDGAGNAIGNLHDRMFQNTQLGQCPEPSSLTVTAGVSPGPSGWTAAHKLSGIAAAIWRLRYDSKQKFYQNGVPDPMWVLKGVRVYDPRQDSTYAGGSGDCRWDDENTWVWDGIDPGSPAGENPYLHGLSWCIGRYQNGKRVMGLGASIDQIIVANFVEGANIADANGWKVSGVLYSRPDTKWNNLKLILQAGAGEPLRIGARIGCRVETPRVSLATITRDDIIGDAQLATMQSKRVRVNTIIPRYRSEDHDWQVVPAAAITVEDYLPDDGDERTREVEYPLVPSVAQAATLARYEIENSREFGPGNFPLKPRWMGLRPGDCVTLDIEDVENQKVLLLQDELDPGGARVSFVLRSETDAKHPFALGQTGTPPPIASVGAYDPSVAAPDPTEWVLTSTSIAAGGVTQPALLAQGSVANAHADAAIWDYRIYDAAAGDEDNWLSAGIESPRIKKKQIPGIAPGTQYQVSVRYRVRGVIGDRLILDPVTSGQFGTAVIPEATGGSGSHNASWTAFDTISSNVFVPLAPAKTITLGAGENLNGDAGLDYWIVTGPNGAARTASLKWQYSPAGAGTWSDIAPATSGTVATAPPVGEGGQVYCAQAASGLAAGDYDVRLMAQLNAGFADVAFVGTATIDASV